MQSIKKGVINVFVTKVLVAFAGLVTVILTSKYLGAEGRGVVSLFTSSVALLQLFCDFGSSSALINLSYRINQRRLWLSALLWVFFISLLSYGFIYFFADIAYIFLVPVAAFFYSILNIHCLLLMGNRMVTKRNILLVIQPVLLLIFFIAYFFNSGLGVGAYPIAFITALFISVMISWQFIQNKLQAESQGKFIFEKQILTQGFWAQGGHTIQFLNYRINFFLIVFFLGNAALGVYNNAIVIAESLWILGHSMGQMMHMKILNTESDIEHRRITNKMMVYNFAGTIVFLIVLLYLPASFWEWLFSKEFTSINGLFIWLAPGIICFSISNILNHYFHAKNQFKIIVWCNAIGLLVGLVLCIFFIPVYELKGASMAWSAGLFVSMLVYLQQYCKKQDDD